VDRPDPSRGPPSGLQHALQGASQEQLPNPETASRSEIEARAGIADADRQGADAGEDAGAFKNSAKGAAVARAFARIMEKTRPDDRGTSILSVRRCDSRHTVNVFSADTPRHLDTCHLGQTANTWKSGYSYCPALTAARDLTFDGC
jgi:hypothetical protein